MASLHVALCTPDNVTGVSSFVFTESGGSIGRSPQCEWSIDDGERFISSTHLLVSFVNGKFTFTDTSSNGTYLNKNQLTKGMAIEPSVHDVFTLGNIDIKITAIDCSTENLEHHAQSDLLSYVSSPDTKTRAPSDSVAPSTPVDQPHDQIDNLGLFDILAKHPSTPTLAQNTHTHSNTDASISTSTNSASHHLIPDNWDSDEPLPPLNMDKHSEVKDSTASAHASVPNSVNDDFFDLLYEKLGLSKSNKADIDKHQFAADIATVITQSTQGVMALLAGRSALKQESRLSMTMIQPKSNNPIKFSLDPSDTLDMLLVRKKPGYMNVNEAYTEAFEDLQHHQTAFIAGLQACLEGVLNELSPDAVAQEAHTSHRNFLGKTKAVHKWQCFAEKQENLLVKVKENFNDILAAHFSTAYELHVKQLQRKENKS